MGDVEVGDELAVKAVVKQIGKQIGKFGVLHEMVRVQHKGVGSGEWVPVEELVRPVADGATELVTQWRTHAATLRRGAENARDAGKTQIAADFEARAEALLACADDLEGVVDGTEEP